MSETKTKPSQSNTLRGAVLALAASIVALILGVLVMLEVIDATEAALITGLVAPVLGSIGAIWAAYGRYNPTIKPIRPKDKSNPRGAGPWLFVLCILAAVLVVVTGPGCGSSFVCSESYVRQLQPTKPFKDNAVCDGEEVFSASGPIDGRFRVRCPEGKAPSFEADGTVHCEAGP